MSKISNNVTNSTEYSDNGKVEVNKQQGERHWDFMKGCWSTEQRKSFRWDFRYSS